MLAHATADSPKPTIKIASVILVAGSLAYTLTLGLLIQLVLLPFVFTDWHAGHGLLAGYDYSAFHAIAVDLAETIRREGWGGWTLFPAEQPVACIAAIFYALIVPEPWTLLPLNAAFHATGTLVLYLILRQVTGSPRYALPAAIPFLVFPTSLTWTVQLHNDSCAVTGSLLYLYGWVLLGQDRTWARSTRAIGSAALMLAGSSLVWVVRPFLIEIFAVAGATFLVVLFSVRIRRARRSDAPLRHFVLPLFVLFIVLLSLVSVGRNASRQPRELSVTLSDLENQPATECPGQGSPVEAIQSFTWKRTALLPGFVDSRLRAVAVERDNSLVAFACGASNIDMAVRFGSATELLSYVPRALEVGLLAPFPDMWFGSGSQESSTAMRRVAGVEMFLAYLSLIALPYSLWRWRGSPALWLTVAFCLGMLTLYTVVTPNVGTLVRFRYAFFIPIVGLGVAG